MWLILSAPEDDGASLLGERMRARGLDPLVHASSEDFGLAQWIYRTGGEIESAHIVLPNGTAIESIALRGVLNRLYAVPASALARVRRSDRAYAQEELQALYTSWLYGLACPVINRAGASGLCGNWPDRSWWRARSFAAGLPTDDYRWRAGTDELIGDEHIESAVLVDGLVVEGAVPVELRPACTRLAEHTDSRLLGLQFSVDAQIGWRLFDANPLPDLSQSGDSVVNALVHALGGP